VVLAQLEVPIATIVQAFETARERGATTVLNPAPAQELPSELLTLCDVVVPNEHEVELLGGTDRLLALGARAVIVTLGSRGAALHTAAGGDVPVAPFEVETIDTTAAGDTFCGVLAGALCSGAAIPDALRRASAAAALATTRLGAQSSAPNGHEIEALLTACGAPGDALAPLAAYCGVTDYNPPGRPDGQLSDQDA
jgi:ribokinase